MSGAFFEITLIVSFAAIVAIVFKLIKQPVVLAYIFTGIFLSLFGAFEVANANLLHSLSKIGITLLLFILGLEIKFSELRTVGKVALITGIGQIVFTSIIGFVILKFIGFSNLAAVYASVALTFSSTIIIVKLLSDKKDIDSLFGRIAIGFLLVQDFFAILALILLTSLNSVSDSLSMFGLVGIFLKIILLFGGSIFLSKTIFPKIIHKLADSQELLFLVSLAWALGLASFASSELIGFSVEIGGFLAGLTLANSTESLHIVSKIRSIRDFFIMIFFVLLGMDLQFDNILPAIPPAILLSAFVLVGNPLIVMTLLGMLGYTKRTGFLAGLTVAQISEFSLIVISLGKTIGHVPENVVTIITLVGIITFTFSTYAILYGEKLYEIFKPYLGIFERKKLSELDYEQKQHIQGHIVLLGAHRLGQEFLRQAKNTSKDILVVDFDPEVVNLLEKKKFNIIYGDISDSEIIEKASLENAKLVISSIPDLKTNVVFLTQLKDLKKRPLSVVIARRKENVKILRNAGADYVILPYELIGNTLASSISSDDFAILSQNKTTIKKNISESFKP